MPCISSLRACTGEADLIVFGFNQTLLSPEMNRFFPKIPSYALTIPEPSALVLLLVAGGGLLAGRRRSNR